MKEQIKLAYENTKTALMNCIFGLLVFSFPTIAMIWGFNFYEWLSIRIAVSVAMLMLPIVVAYLYPTNHGFKVYALWIGLIYALLILVLIGDLLDIQLISFSAMFGLMSLPPIWIIKYVIKSSWSVLASLFFAMGLAIIYFTGSTIQHDGPFELVFYPLPALLFIGTVWAFLTSRSIELAQLKKDYRLAGPGWQSLAMLMLALPIFLVSYAVPIMVQLHELWQTISLAIFGVLFSALVSDPLRRFLVEWNGLTPEQPGCEDQPQDEYPHQD